MLRHLKKQPKRVAKSAKGRLVHKKGRSSPRWNRSCMDFVGIVDRYKDAVVNIEVAQETQPQKPLPFPFNLPMFNTPEMQPQAMNIGTGFIFDERGYILTNEHVIHGAKQVQVRMYGKGKPLTAQVVGTHYEHDMAVLKVTLPHAVPVLRLGQSNGVKVGEWVIAIGNPIVSIRHKRR